MCDDLADSFATSMTQAGSRKLGFTIHLCSGEDQDYPAKELLQHREDSRGWQSPRCGAIAVHSKDLIVFCAYPQELILQLDTPAQLEQIQLLSHQYKIAKSMVLYVGTAESGGPCSAQTAMWRRLGSLAFDANERSQFAARELKSVRVATPAALLRLAIQECHANPMNTYKQVGLVSVTLVGQPLLGGAPPVDTTDAAAPVLAPLHPNRPAPLRNGHATKAPSGAAAEGLDAAGTERLCELTAAKAAAVAVEDYDEAKRLKALVDALRTLGTQIAQLEARKRAAVECEDYDAAKALKLRIHALRAGATPVTPGIAALPLEDRPLRASAASSASTTVGVAPRGAAGSPPLCAGDRVLAGSVERGAEVAAALSAAAAPPGRAAFSSGMAEPRMPSKDYDERPVLPRAPQAPAEPCGHVPSTSAAPHGPPRMRTPQAPAQPPLPSAGLGGGGMDLLAPEALSAADAKEAEGEIALLGEHTARCLFSRNWQLREAGLQRATRLLQHGEGSTAQADLARGAGRCAVRALRDRVPNVLQAGLALLRAALGPGPGGGPPLLTGREALALAAEATPVLIDKVGDSNARVGAAAGEALVWLASCGEATLGALAPVLLRPVPSQVAWRPVLGRLGVLAALVARWGCARPGGEGGLPLEPLMRFAGAAAGSANGDVRAAAAALFAQVGSLAGPAVLKYLPAGVNAKLEEQLQAALAGGRASPPVPALAEAARRRATAAGPRLGGPSKAGVKCRGTPPGPARNPAPQAKQNGTAAPLGAQTAWGRPGQETKAAAHGAASAMPAAATVAVPPRDVALDYARAGAHLQPPAVPQPSNTYSSGAGAPPPPATSHFSLPEAATTEPLLPAGAMPGGGEVATYEAELAAREAALGPGHPGVAEALSDLAILHNQAGAYDLAQPLYERALAIFEATRGPSHPEVAHTLTDLAVLHLEQGNDVAGRPLLERALAIQEAALGPHHPDVVAIRDVLESDD